MLYYFVPLKGDFPKMLNNLKTFSCPQGTIFENISKLSRQNFLQNLQL